MGLRQDTALASRRPLDLLGSIEHVIQHTAHQHADSNSFESVQSLGHKVGVDGQSKLWPGQIVKWNASGVRLGWAAGGVGLDVDVFGTSFAFPSLRESAALPKGVGGQLSLFPGKPLVICDQSLLDKR